MPNEAYKKEKLTIRLEYDKDVGLATNEFINYLQGINKSYSRFTNKKSQLSINHVKEGSVIIEFIETVVQPVMAGVISNGVYEFGKHIIYALTYGKTNFTELSSRFKNGVPEAIHTVQTIGDITGNNNTINVINIKAYADKAKELNDRITQEESEKLQELVKLLVKQKNKQDELPIKKYESIELKFSTVSKKDSQGRFTKYVGYATELSNKPKKITFESDALKEEFDFEHDPFNKLYLVSINVHYNADNSIGRYEITEFIDTLNA